MKAKEAMAKAEAEEEAQLQTLLDEITKVNPSTSEFNTGKGVNTPKMTTGMIPIKYNGTNWVICSESDEEWYSYIDENNDGTVDVTEKNGLMSC